MRDKVGSEVMWLIRDYSNSNGQLFVFAFELLAFQRCRAQILICGVHLLEFRVTP